MERRWHDVALTSLHLSKSAFLRHTGNWKQLLLACDLSRCRFGQVTAVHGVFEPGNEHLVQLCSLQWTPLSGVRGSEHFSRFRSGERPWRTTRSTDWQSQIKGCDRARSAMRCPLLNQTFASGRWNPKSIAITAPSLLDGKVYTLW